MKARRKVKPKIVSGIAFLLEFQKLQKVPERNFASRKSNLLRFKRTISHSGWKQLTPATNLPLPYAITALRNDDMKFVRHVSLVADSIAVFGDHHGPSAIFSSCAAGDQGQAARWWSASANLTFSSARSAKLV